MPGQMSNLYAGRVDTSSEIKPWLLFCLLFLETPILAHGKVW